MSAIEKPNSETSISCHCSMDGTMSQQRAVDIVEAKKAENLQKWRSTSGKFTVDGHHIEDDNQEETNGTEAGAGN